MSECPYPGCERQADHRPYARKRDGIPSVSTIAGSLDNGRARSFAWTAAGIAATEAVHNSEAWWNLPTTLYDKTTGEHSDCTHEPGGFCRACMYLRSEFDREWKYKANLGSHLHHMALDWAEDREVEVDGLTEGYLDGLERFYNTYDPQFQHLEQTIHGEAHGLHYRGQFDSIVDLNDTPRGTLDMIDYKSGKLHVVEATIQLAGYRWAGDMTQWVDGEELFFGEPVPEVNRAGCLYLSEFGDFELVWLPVDDVAKIVFDHLLAIYYWQQQMNKWEKEHLKETADAE